MLFSMEFIRESYTLMLVITEHTTSNSLPYLEKPMWLYVLKNVRGGGREHDGRCLALPIFLLVSRTRGCLPPCAPSRDLGQTLGTMVCSHPEGPLCFRTPRLRYMLLSEDDSNLKTRSKTIAFLEYFSSNIY